MVIAGAGLAGLACAHELGRKGVDVTLVDRNDYHQFQPLLYQVATSQLPAADVEKGCRAVTICHIGNIAEWLGRSLAWDPQKEEFVNDAEANRWLDRPKRAPWNI